MTADFESIATETLTSNASTITFSSIPSTFAHLQVRIIGRTTRPDGVDYATLRFNGNSSSIYSSHDMYTNGNTSPQTDRNLNQSSLVVQRFATNVGAANVFSAMIIDILDYKETTKFKTLRWHFGYSDGNTTMSRAGLSSGLWASTSAISSMSFQSGYGENYIAGTRFALYGIRG